MEPGLSANARPLVSLAVVTWNSGRFLPRSLETLRGQTWPDVELLAIDNASSDDSVEQLERTGFRVVRNDENRGFSAAVNQALALASGEFLLVVNPDCRLAPDYAERLVGALESAGPGFGSATGLLIRAAGEAIEPTDRVDSAGIRMTRTGRHLDLGQGEPASAAASVFPADDRLPGGAFEVFGVSGAAAMYRIAFLRDAAVDGEALDEDFFAYREDADLAWRGRLFGWRALCEPRALGWHVRRVTPATRRSLPAEVNAHSVKNRFLLRLKNEGAYLALRNLPGELFRDLVVVAATLTIERSSLSAFAWLWKNRRRVLAKRREIQARRRVSDRALARWFR
jgi:GT2 family glycosyltransferase